MTSIKQSKLKRSLSILILTISVLALSACGGGKKISTKDNSVDYRSAKSLPPLKKPSRVVVAAPKSPTIAPATAVEEAVDTAAAIEETVPVDVAEPVVESTVLSTDVVEELDTQEPELTASVVSAKSGQARLEVAADFDQAWDYLSSSLQKSDLTVFSRNKAAGRFSIGCANIAAAPTVVKSGRWSFFNRDKQQNLEYCALQVETKRGNTTVSVLNRAGEEVSGEYSNKIFNRILNN